MERQKASDAPIFISKSDFFASKSDFGPPGGSPGGQFFFDTDDIFKYLKIFENYFVPRTQNGPSISLRFVTYSTFRRFP